MTTGRKIRGRRGLSAAGAGAHRPLLNARARTQRRCAFASLASHPAFSVCEVRHPVFPGWRRAPLGRRGGDTASGVATSRGCAVSLAACPSTAVRAALAPSTPVARRGASVASLRCALCGTEMTELLCVEGASARRSACAGGALRTGGVSLARKASALLRRASDARRRGGTWEKWAPAAQRGCDASRRTLARQPRRHGRHHRDSARRGFSGARRAAAARRGGVGACTVSPTRCNKGHGPLNIFKRWTPLKARHRVADTVSPTLDTAEPRRHCVVDTVTCHLDV